MSFDLADAIAMGPPGPTDIKYVVVLPSNQTWYCHKKINRNNNFQHIQAEFSTLKLIRALAGRPYFPSIQIYRFTVFRACKLSPGKYSRSTAVRIYALILVMKIAFWKLQTHLTVTNVTCIEVKVILLIENAVYWGLGLRGRQLLLESACAHSLVFAV